MVPFQGALFECDFHQPAGAASARAAARRRRRGRWKLYRQRPAPSPAVPPAQAAPWPLPSGPRPSALQALQPAQTSTYIRRQLQLCPSTNEYQGSGTADIMASATPKILGPSTARFLMAMFTARRPSHLCQLSMHSSPAYISHLDEQRQQHAHQRRRASGAAVAGALLPRRGHRHQQHLQRFCHHL